MKVLFVCKGNMGRSQALREFTTRAVQERSSLRSKIEIDSAGTDAEAIAKDKGNPDRISLTPNLVEAYRRQFEIDPATPNRKAVTKRLVEQSDLVLVAEPRLMHKLQKRFPGHHSKIRTVKEYLFGKWIGERRQVIDDPVKPTTRRFGAKKPVEKELVRYKMLKECKGIAERLARKWDLER